MTEQAFREIYAEYRDSLFRFAYRLTGSQATAEDLVHDCFVGLFRNGFDPKLGTIRTYLYAAVRNLTRKYYRSSGREYDLVETDHASTPDSALDSMVAHETAELVRFAIESLPPLQREAIVLFEYEELSLEEVCAVVDADLAAVKSRLYRARESLRKVLAPLREVR